MAKIKGICKNIDGCDLAADKVIQEVDSFEFKCQECGKELSLIDEKKKRKKSGIPTPLVIGIAAVALLGILGFLFFGGSSSDEEQLPPEVVSDSIASKDTTAAAPITINNTVIIGDSVPQRDTIIKHDTVKVTVPVRERNRNTAPAASSGTLRLSNGVYTGDHKNGLPHGMGRMTFNTASQIESRDSKGRVAEVGDYVIGEYSEGHLVQGTWYGSDNQVKGSLLIGK